MAITNEENERGIVDHQNHLVNHVAVVLDESESMKHVASQLIAVADAEIAFLAQHSQQMKQETRVSVYAFNEPTNVRCLIWDMDVLRLPSIASMYHPQGMTALIDASLLALRDLALIPEKYGNHAFLMYVMTDGAENKSVNLASVLERELKGAPENRTIAFMVPNARSKFLIQQMGVPAGNIAIWDATTKAGVTEAGETMRAATTNFMNLRATGQSNTRTIFSTDASAVNAATVAAAGLTPLDPSKYVLIPITKPKANEGVLNKNKERVWEIAQFSKHATGTYEAGRAFYQFTKQETIGGNKNLAVLRKQGKRLYVGDGVRDLIGLPTGADIRVAPDFNPDYTIFVQSQSTNRHLVANTDLLILK